MEVKPDNLLSHFSLTEEPFGAPANPRFLFKGQVHEEALAMLELGIATRRGLVVIVGEVGTGKTTVAKAIMESAGPKAHVAYISNSTLGFMDLLREAFSDWGIAKGRTKGQMISNLREFATQRTEEGEIVALIVDEAQALSDAVFEELRQLLNLETTEYKLVQIILLGQPELQEKLRNPKLRHVADRVAMRGNTQPLNREESHEYIKHRLSIAGGDPTLFSPRARKAIVREAAGIPRAINAICHNALLFAFANGSASVDHAAAREATDQRYQGRLGRWPPRGRLSRAAAAALIAVSILATVFVIRALAKTPNQNDPLVSPPAFEQP